MRETHRERLREVDRTDESRLVRRVKNLRSHTTDDRCKIAT